MRVKLLDQIEAWESHRIRIPKVNGEGLEGNGGFLSCGWFSWNHPIWKDLHLGWWMMILRKDTLYLCICSSKARRNAAEYFWMLDIYTSFGICFWRSNFVRKRLCDADQVCLFVLRNFWFRDRAIHGKDVDIELVNSGRIHELVQDFFHQQ